MLSVLAGLIFVGLEMRQSQRIAIGAQQQTRAQMGMETAFHWSDNGMDSEVFFRANDFELTKEEISYLRMDANVWWYIMKVILNNMNWDFFLKSEYGKPNFAE